MRRILALAIALPLVAAASARGQEPLYELTNLEDLERHGGRFYLAGIMGSSFATLTSPDIPSSSGPLFTSGGAAGVAFAALDRAWRLEVEGRARDPLSETTTLADGVSTSALAATGGWSTTVNLWRDFDLTERWTCYLGGGIGGGGYRFAVNQEFPIQDATITGVGTVGGFAWQAGGGLGWAITERITLDLGYRFFAIDAGNVAADISQTGFLIDTTSVGSAFSASELFFAIRIYEPFRRWR